MLVKLQRAEFIPGTPGVPARPEETVCYDVYPPAQPPRPGHWETICETHCWPVGDGQEICSPTPTCVSYWVYD